MKIKFKVKYHYKSDEGLYYANITLNIERKIVDGERWESINDSLNSTAFLFGEKLNSNWGDLTEGFRYRTLEISNPDIEALQQAVEAVIQETVSNLREIKKENEEKIKQIPHSQEFNYEI